jgi:hypothetical protein
MVVLLQAVRDLHLPKYCLDSREVGGLHAEFLRDTASLPPL